MDITQSFEERIVWLIAFPVQELDLLACECRYVSHSSRSYSIAREGLHGSSDSPPMSSYGLRFARRNESTVPSRIKIAVVKLGVFLFALNTQLT